MAKEIENVNKSHSTSASAMIPVALAVLIFPQVLGFLQPPSFLVQNRATTLPSCRSVASINEHRRPWCLQASAEGIGAEVGARKTARTAATAPLSLVEEIPLSIPDPDVRETDEGYALTFNLPAEVTEDGLDLSVSGRLLTIEARVTREKSDNIASTSGGDNGNNKGCVTSTTRTHAAARSFILPDDVSNEMTASWVADGEVEVRLVKEAPDVASTAYFPASGTSNSAQSSSGMEDSGGIPVESRRDETKPSVPSSAAEEYLSGVKSRLSSVGLTPATTSTDSEASTQPTHQHHQRRSLLAALDDEFRDLVKAMWTGDNAVRFPTEEQVAATVERAREERKRRVTALRRATMATHVSENERAYVVKVALPDGATRDDVKLMVTPYNNDLRVIFFGEGHRTVSKAVHLPRDALFTDISATFTPETAPEKEREGVSDASSGRRARGGRAATSENQTCGGVSSLEMTVGRVLPKSIDIK